MHGKSSVTPKNTSIGFVRMHIVLYAVNKWEQSDEHTLPQPNTIEMWRIYDKWR